MSHRIDIQFPSENLQCHGWLYLPETERPRPVVVLAHGLGAIREMRLDAYAERFREAGYAALVFDYRHFGASEGEPRQLLSIKRQLHDWNSALRFVRNRTDVDGSRVVLWGTSFSGGHVIVIGANDGRVSAVISQCPFTDPLASFRTVDPVSMLKVGGLALMDAAGAWLGRAPVMVPAAGKAKTAALMTTPDAEPGYLALVPLAMDFPNRVAARFALDVSRYFPGRKASAVKCPVLFCVCETDSVAPAKTTLRHVRKAPQGEIRLYPEGHFDIYMGEAFERVVTDQIAFLKRHLPG